MKISLFDGAVTGTITESVFTIDDPEQSREFLRHIGEPDESVIKVEVWLTTYDYEYLLTQKFNTLEVEPIGDLTIYNPSRQSQTKLDLRRLQVHAVE